MKRSIDRILTTHTGSLPRPMDLTAMLEALDSGECPTGTHSKPESARPWPRWSATR